MLFALPMRSNQAIFHSQRAGAQQLFFRLFISAANAQFHSWRFAPNLFASDPRVAQIVNRRDRF